MFKNQKKKMARPAGLEPAAFGSGDKTLEFHNLLIFNKLLKPHNFRLADFCRFSILWQILEGFSHTDSHTQYLTTPRTLPDQGSKSLGAGRYLWWAGLISRHQSLEFFKPVEDDDQFCPTPLLTRMSPPGRRARSFRRNLSTSR